MTVLEKAYLLQSKIAKASLDVEYSIGIKCGNDKDEKLAKMRTMAKNAIELFGTGRINSLDYDVREKAIRDWQERLEAALSCFPDYEAEEEKQQTR